MKTIARFTTVALLTLGGVALAPAAQAQISVNFNLGRPAWGPALPAGAEFYYIPEVGGYYDVPTKEYVVQRNGKWTRTRTLNGYNTANFHPVVVKDGGRQPWTHYDQHRKQYPNRGGNNQNQGNNNNNGRGNDHNDNNGRGNDNNNGRGNNHNNNNGHDNGRGH